MLEADAVIFDLDGTLLDDESAVNAAVKIFYTIHKGLLGMTLNEFAISWGAALRFHSQRYLDGEVSFAEQRRARLRDLFASSLPTMPDGKADRMFDIYERGYSAAWLAFPDAVPALIALKRYQLAVLTNGELAQQTRKLQAVGLAGYFSGIFASSEIGYAKPQPQAFQQACARLHLEPQKCVYVGDDLTTDACASASAGLISFWLDRKTSHIRPPDGIHRIQSLSEMLQLLFA